MPEAHREFEIGNLFLNALDFSLCAFDGSQAQERRKIDEEHGRNRHHQFAHIIAVKFKITFHGQSKADQTDDCKD